MSGRTKRVRPIASARVAAPENVAKQDTIAALVEQVARLTAALERSERERADLLDKARGPLFREFISSWWALQGAKELEHTTVSNYEMVINAHLLPEFGDLRLGDIKDEQIARWQTALREKRRLKRGTVAAYAKVLRTIMRAAVEQGKLQRVPVITRSNDNTEQTWLAEDEARRVIAEAKKDGDMAMACVLLALDAGLRHAEAIGLRRTNIIDGCIHVVEQRDAKDLVRPPKYGRTRIVPLTDRLAVVLSRLAADATDTDGYVLRGKGGAPMYYGAAARALRKYTRRAGITRPIKYHSARHSFISSLGKAKVGIGAVKRLAGHAHLATTERYMHTEDEEMFEAVAALKR